MEKLLCYLLDIRRTKSGYLLKIAIVGLSFRIKSSHTAIEWIKQYNLVKPGTEVWSIHVAIITLLGSNIFRLIYSQCKLY